jgi:hypothetical protein
MGGIVAAKVCCLMRLTDFVFANDRRHSVSPGRKENSSRSSPTQSAAHFSVFPFGDPTWQRLPYCTALYLATMLTNPCYHSCELRRTTHLTKLQTTSWRYATSLFHQSIYSVPGNKIRPPLRTLSGYHRKSLVFCNKNFSKRVRGNSWKQVSLLSEAERSVMSTINDHADR